MFARFGKEYDDMAYTLPRVFGNDDTERLKEKAGRILNPYLKSDGSLVNPYIDYSALVESDKTSNRVKRLITEATGIEPSEQQTGTQNTRRTSRTQRTGTGSATTYQGGSPAGNEIAQAAKSQVGAKYVYGGSSPSGFDCSGLAQYAYAQSGVNIPRTSQEQFNGGQAVSTNNLMPGDLVFFAGSQGSISSPGHVGVYIGGGQYVQAPQTGETVKISNLSARSDYAGARRYY